MKSHRLNVLEEVADKAWPEIYWGIDCGGKSIHAVSVNKYGVVNLDSTLMVITKKRDLDERLIDLISLFKKSLPTHRFMDSLVGEFAVIENPIHIQNARTTIGMTHVIAGVKLALSDMGIGFLSVDNKVWKRDVLGDGKSDKDKIKAFAIRRFGLKENLEQDFYDAACIALWGCWRFNRKGVT